MVGFCFRGQNGEPRIDLSQYASGTLIISKKLASGMLSLGFVYYYCYRGVKPISVLKKLWYF